MFSLTLAKILGGRHFGIPRHFKRISINSKETKEGELFIPLKGNRFDGHLFVEEALTKGAAGFLFERGKVNLNKIKLFSRRGFAIEVENTFRALKKIAAYKRSLFKGKEIIAITGSAGKTTTKELIAHLLGEKFSVYKTPKNFNSQIGLPLSLANAPTASLYWVFELGADRRGAIKELAALLKPTIGVITALGKAHTSGFGNFSNLLCAKGEIFLPPSVKGGVIPKGFKNCYLSLGKSFLIPEEEFPVRKVRFMKEGKTLITFEKFQIEVPLLGWGIVKATQTALTVLKLLQLPIEEFIKSFATFRGEWGRMQHLFFGDYGVINDAYNANPLSVAEALKTLAQTEGYQKRVVLLGDMLELGPYEKQEHRKIGKLIDSLPIDEVFLLGKATKYTCQQIKRAKCFHSEDKEKLLRLVKRYHPQKGTLYLVKGSRGLKMEDFLIPLAEKKFSQ